MLQTLLCAILGSVSKQSLKPRTDHRLRQFAGVQEQIAAINPLIGSIERKSGLQPFICLNRDGQRFGAWVTEQGEATGKKPFRSGMNNLSKGIEAAIKSDKTAAYTLYS